ncbi:MAG: response regulator, partial [Thalassococcus sp.]|uniref:hybrid sensor histidine kinase/response regulator n=1 Tax=Thalassococcus sp. TaxID=1928858 RepID=UPI001B022B33
MSVKLLAATVVVCLAFVVGLSWMISKEIDKISTATSDNAQWTVAQVDVELLRYRLALETDGSDPADLRNLRRRFDVFYSRMSTLLYGNSFIQLRNSPNFAGSLDRLLTFLEETVPIIDGDDPQLIAALPDLQKAAVEITPVAREMTLAGLAAFAENTRDRRQEVMKTLVILAVFVMILLAILIVAAAKLMQMNTIARRHAAEVEQASEQLKTIVETSLDAIVLADFRGRILTQNPAADTMFGSLQDRATINLKDLFSPDETKEKFDFIGTGKPLPAGSRRFEIQSLHKDGIYFPAEVSIDRSGGGEDQVYVAYIRDISRRKNAEDALRDARDRALAGEKAKSEFLAVMSHEMRTPLNGILGTMQLMRPLSTGQRENELLDRMESSGRLLLSLVNDVLDLSKYEAGKLTLEDRAFALPDLLKGIVDTNRPMATANGNSLNWSWVGPERNWVRGDQRRLRQILLNLVSNAVKFTRNGEVEIEVEEMASPSGTIEFRVIDTGIGIGEEDIERIFQDFETLDSSYARQAGGTGLGLGIVRRLVNMMGGEIGAESEPGEGSLFWVRIPFNSVDHSDVVNDDVEVPITTPTGERSLSVLLVEDNEINRFVARELLNSEGHKVTEAANGQEGVELANETLFDLILMDISMPVKDGVAATIEIRAGDGASSGTPIIAVTAHALPEEVEGFLKSGMQDCLSKPIERNALKRILAQVAYSNAVVTTDKVAHQNGTKLPYFDPSQLEALASALGFEQVETLINRLRAEGSATTDRLMGMSTNDPELAAVVHQFAGSCASFGLTSLRESLYGIEGKKKSGALVSNSEIEALKP